MIFIYDSKAPPEKNEERILRQEQRDKQKEKVSNIMKDWVKIEKDIGYEKLEKEDFLEKIKEYIHLHSFLKKNTFQNRYDIIILSNIITYIGDHFNLFSQINKIASDKAIIALSFRLLQQDEVMNLVEQGSENFSFIRAVQQFWYDANYLENLLQENGWFIWQKEPIKFVTNENGMIIIASKQKINNSFDSTLINEINSNETNNIDQDEEKSNKVISS